VPGLSPADASTLSAYAEGALRSMAKVLDRVEDDELNVRPLGEHTNSLASLVVHSCATSGYWLGHVAAGRPSGRDRDSEFVAVADRADLVALLESTVVQIDGDLRSIADQEPRHHEMRAFLHGDQGDLSVTIHALEELYQHLGHMDVTADALIAERS
jgi:hypothetical protein